MGPVKKVMRQKLKDKMSMAMLVREPDPSTITYSGRYDVKSSSDTRNGKPRGYCYTLGHCITHEVKSEAPVELQSGTSRY